MRCTAQSETAIFSRQGGGGEGGRRATLLSLLLPRDGAADPKYSKDLQLEGFQVGVLKPTPTYNALHCSHPGCTWNAINPRVIVGWRGGRGWCRPTRLASAAMAVPCRQCCDVLIVSCVGANQPNHPSLPSIPDPCGPQVVQGYHVWMGCPCHRSGKHAPGTSHK